MVSLANCTDSLMEPVARIPTTGPNVSSRMTNMSWSHPSITVGVKK